MLKEGLYWVGDPCYVLKENNGWDWGDILEQTKFFGGDQPCEIKGKKGSYQVCVYGTAYGDGSYSGSDGKEYSVDAGLIGVIPLKALPSIKGKHGDGIDCGHIYYFSDDFLCEDEAGLLTFGGLVIDTLQEDEEDTCGCCGNPL